jgi:hypothetical protein
MPENLRRRLDVNDFATPVKTLMLIMKVIMGYGYSTSR